MIRFILAFLLLQLRLFAVESATSLSVTMDGDKVKVTVSGNPNAYYRIIRSTNLFQWEYYNSVKTASDGANSLSFYPSEQQSFFQAASGIGPQLIILTNADYESSYGIAPLQTSLFVIENLYRTNDCEVREGEITIGYHKLIGFQLTLINAGDCDYKSPTRVERPDLFHESLCHAHLHLQDFTRFTVLSTDGVELGHSRKEGWCLTPARPLAGYNPSPAYPGRYGCQNPGLMPGWSDTYGFTTGMWFDVTGLQDGWYILRFEIDPYSNFGDGANFRLEMNVKLIGNEVKFAGFR